VPQMKALLALCGVVLALGVALVRAPGAYASFPRCDSKFALQHVVGGNTTSSQNGNPSSRSWLRGQGARDTFLVEAPLNDTLRTDCYGPVQGSDVKVRFANDDGSISNSSLSFGYEMINCCSGGYSNSPEEDWIVDYHNPVGSDDLYNISATNTNVIGNCHLGGTPQVSLRIVRVGTSRSWEAECWAGSLGWQTAKTVDTTLGGKYTGYVEGVAQGEDWRYGGAGTTLEDIFSNLQWYDWTENWIPFVGTQCFANTSDNYRWGVDINATQPAYDVFNSTPNPDC